MAKSRLLLGPAAVSVLAAASLAGAPAAAADDVCLECEPQFNVPGLNTAFVKLEFNEFPGATGGVFECCIMKIHEQPAIVKLAELKFPGNTEFIFFKE
ncbi:MAG TPA: hypothetical protein VK278_07840 [Gaiellaceae bacterium]|nr:hypothetical protein [Gaiellaceae bacterium]